jgi:hypothetical protein
MSRGRLDAENGFEQRVRVDFDGHAAADAGSVECGGRTIRLTANVLPAPSVDTPGEVNRIISLAAAEASLEEGAVWERIPGLGSRGAALRSRLGLASVGPGDAGKPISLRFRTGDEADAELRVVALPAHLLTSTHGLRLGVQVDDGAIQVLDFETHGRSEEWKRNVLSNSAVRSIALPRLAAGAHQVRLYALDPGFLLDRVDVRLDGAHDYYGAPPDR